MINVESLAYRAFHASVVAHIARVLERRWPDSAVDNANALRFFDTQCTYDEAFFDGRDPDEEAEANVEAACDSV